jgi:hypothetical protein
MPAPTVRELLGDPIVRRALDAAWADSLPTDDVRRHEEGGWIYADIVTGALAVERAPAGGQASLDLSTPPILLGRLVVGTFHTHPNPISEGEQALAIAQVDAARSYRDLSGYRICLVLEDDGWHIDYELKDPALTGGGPHYVIDADTGDIVSRRYEQ